MLRIKANETFRFDNLSIIQLVEVYAIDQDIKDSNVPILQPIVELKKI